MHYYCKQWLWTWITPTIFLFFVLSFLYKESSSTSSSRCYIKVFLYITLPIRISTYSTETRAGTLSSPTLVDDKVYNAVPLPAIRSQSVSQSHSVSGKIWIKIQTTWRRLDRKKKSVCKWKSFTYGPVKPSTLCAKRREIAAACAPGEKATDESIKICCTAI